VAKYKTIKKERIKKYLLKKDGYRCFYCRKKFAYKDLIVEHIVPRSRGGSGNINNTVLACNFCNSSKCNQLIEEWLDKNDLRVVVLYREYRHRKTISNTLQKMVFNG